MTNVSQHLISGMSSVSCILRILDCNVDWVQEAYQGLLRLYVSNHVSVNASSRRASTSVVFFLVDLLKTRMQQGDGGAVPAK